MLELSQVSKRYPGSGEVLRHVTFTMRAGEMAFLTGHSGAGKSTLLKLIALIERPTNGGIVVGGQNLARLSRRQVPRLRRGIGVVFQDNRLLAERTVFDNVALPLVVAGAEPREIPRRVRAALDKVGLLAKEKHLPPTLSGGEASRVGIARAVVSRPALLLADEPTGNLDSRLSDEILELFLDFHRHGTTVLIASHDERLIARAGARVLKLDHGALVADTAS
jgi:cell division transport system ATP-binding protein